jgi:ribosomal protein L40E
VTNAIRDKRSSAKSDITTFKVGAIIGVIVSIACLVSIFFFPFVSIVSEVMGISDFVVWILILSSVGATPLTAYEFGASLLGIKKTVVWCWNTTIRIIPLTILAVAIFLIASLIILSIGGIIGIFATPIWLYRSRKTLRETAWVETHEEPPYDYTPPSQAQEPPTAHNKANFCTNCGAKNENNANYCPKCGKQQ